MAVPVSDAGDGREIVIVGFVTFVIILVDSVTSVSFRSYFGDIRTSSAPNSPASSGAAAWPNVDDQWLAGVDQRVYNRHQKDRKRQ